MTGRPREKPESLTPSFHRGCHLCHHYHYCHHCRLCYCPPAKFLEGNVFAGGCLFSRWRLWLGACVAVLGMRAVCILLEYFLAMIVITVIFVASTNNKYMVFQDEYITNNYQKTGVNVKGLLL